MMVWGRGGGEFVKRKNKKKGGSRERESERERDLRPTPIEAVDGKHVCVTSYVLVLPKVTPSFDIRHNQLGH